MFRIVYVYLGLFLLSSSASECLREYNRYPLLKQEGWSLRIDDKLDEHGCELVAIYDLLRKEDSILLMDSMDKNPLIIEEIKTLFDNKKVFEIMQKNQIIKDMLMNNADNLQLLKNINYLFDKYLNSAIKRKILKDPVFLNYFILPAATAKDYNQLNEFYKDIRKISSAEGLAVFTLIYTSIGDSYKFTYLLENFFTIKNQLSKNQLKEIAQYPKQLAYFLYPSKEDMKLYGDDVYYQQKEFQKLMISIYKNTYEHLQFTDTNENIVALMTMENIYPYIVRNRNYDELGKLFEVLENKGYIDELWRKTKDICDKKTVEEIFAIFGDDNLNNLLRLQKNENSLYHNLLNSNSEYRSIFSLFYISNVYAKFDTKKWSIFKDLLYNLPDEIYRNVMVLKELDNIKYFERIIQENNYNYFVKANDDDSQGKSFKKYKFILFTSYPSDDDYSVYQYLIGGNIKETNKSLSELYSQTIDGLETHNFTEFEKTMATLDKVEWALTGAAIVAAPFTGGTSLSYIAVRKAGTTAAKKGIKFYAKKLALQSRKLLNKGIYRARQIRSKAYQGMGKKNTQLLGKNLEKADDAFTTLTVGTMAGGMLFLSLPSDLEAKQICVEQE